MGAEPEQLLQASVSEHANEASQADEPSDTIEQTLHQPDDDPLPTPEPADEVPKNAEQSSYPVAEHPPQSVVEPSTNCSLSERLAPKAKPRPRPRSAQPEEPSASGAPLEIEEPEADEQLGDLKVGHVAAALNPRDATPDVFISASGDIVSSLSQGTFRQLTSGVRADVGARRGRYLFEVRVLERIPDAHCELRVGVSSAGSSLFLRGSQNSVSFDHTGAYSAVLPGETEPAAEAASSSSWPVLAQTLGVLLNLNADGAHANTISLYVDGLRVGPRRLLPQHLQDVALFPTVAFRNVTLLVNLGRHQRLRRQLRPLPFTCLMFGDLSEEHAERLDASAPVVSEVVVPVGLPDEGLLDAIRDFMKEHPSHVDLTPRGWACWRQHSSSGPSAHAAVQSCCSEDRSWQPLVATLAASGRSCVATTPRIGAGLSRTERAELLECFQPPLRRIALVTLGATHGRCDTAVQDAQALTTALTRICKQGDDVCLPTAAEGFDEIRYTVPGFDNDQAETYLGKWLSRHKAKLLIDELVPGSWFRSQVKVWRERRLDLKTRCQDYTARRRHAESAGSGTVLDLEAAELDVEAVVDIHDIDGHGVPLYADFKYEDWMLLFDAYELHLLAHAFLSDVSDASRVGIPEEHVPHYYGVYYGTSYDYKAKLGVSSLVEAVKLLCGLVALDDLNSDHMVLRSNLSRDAPIAVFVKEIERYRRERHKRCFIGDESARLCFPRKPVAKAGNAAPLVRIGAQPPDNVQPPKPKAAPRALVAKTTEVQPIAEKRRMPKGSVSAAEMEKKKPRSEALDKPVAKRRPAP